MEEKIVKMKNTEKETPQKDPKKLTYDELENIAQQLSNQNRELYMKVQELNAENMFKRLDYLFKVVENEISFPQTFINNCVEEIQDMMTLPKEEKEEKEEE